ncbi:putative bifunctional diguanylate cyclase/phosphodiesterase [Balneatrix alpica]|uniref:putative bifunctional diguanylate cyclase/phosphodiesterase n=1 Tax=Balneatrix alpica TaxID=75684 RepID=UPI002739EE29|nr:GGDEF and EAL domain-containing protein [Balneatrix alpica]
MKTSRLSKLALYLISLIFLGLSVVSLNGYYRNAHLLSAHIQSNAWSLAQLQLDHRKFVYNLRLYAEGVIEQRELLLSYDLLWNRLSVFLKGRETKELRRRFGAEELAQQLWQQLQAAEPHILNSQSQDAVVMTMFEEFEAFQAPIHELMLLNFTGPEASKQLDGIKASQRQLSINLTGLVISGWLLVLYLWRQSRRYNALAMQDSLTGLLNRSAFQKNLRSEYKPRALVLIDLNHFRQVNDALGQAEGDELLRQVAQVLRRNLAKDALIARLDSDVFALLFKQQSKRAQVLVWLRAVQRQLVFEYKAQDRVIWVDAGIGVTFIGEAQSVDPDLLFDEASLALAEAKRKDHADSLVIFEGWMREQESRRRNLLLRLQRVLKERLVEGPLRLVYQPIYQLRDGRLLGAEALVRWQDPDYGAIAPLELVALMENNGLGKAFGEWLFARLKYDLSRQQLYWPPGMTVALNLSTSLFNEDLATWVQQQAQQAGLAPEQLVLEVTEDIAMIDFARSKAIIASVKACGATIALDDFGTGYSSLSYLRELKVDKLKIDKSFIRDLHENEDQRMFVTSIVSLAHYLGLEVVAEGIETVDEEKVATELGCDQGQGYLYAKPLEVEAMVALLQRSQ